MQAKFGLLAARGTPPTQHAQRGGTCRRKREGGFDCLAGPEPTPSSLLPSLGGNVCARSIYISIVQVCHSIVQVCHGSGFQLSHMVTWSLLCGKQVGLQLSGSAVM
jgi:hypothetical protein